MKIKPKDLASLRGMIHPVMEQIPVASYRAAHPGFSGKQIRWDYFHLVGQPALDFLCNTLYRYMNDDHVDTALKTIIGI